MLALIEASTTVTFIKSNIDAFSSAANFSELAHVATFAAVHVVGLDVNALFVAALRATAAGSVAN